MSGGRGIEPLDFYYSMTFFTFTPESRSMFTHQTGNEN